MQNANECVNLIVRHLKKQGLIVNKNYEKKQKILESEVSANAVKELKIGVLLDRISKYEDVLKTEPNAQVVQQLIMLYNKAIEYYSALNDEKHMAYLQKLQKLFCDESLQRLMEVNDQGKPAATATQPATEIKQKSPEPVIEDQKVDEQQEVVEDPKGNEQPSASVATETVEKA